MRSANLKGKDLAYYTQGQQYIVERMCLALFSMDGTFQQSSHLNICTSCGITKRDGCIDGYAFSVTDLTEIPCVDFMGSALSTQYSVAVCACCPSTTVRRTWRRRVACLKWVRGSAVSGGTCNWHVITTGAPTVSVCHSRHLAFVPGFCQALV